MFIITDISAGHVYKSTLVSQLNSNPNVSKDRLRRVQARMSHDQGDADLDVITSNEVGLYSDVAVYIKDKGKDPEYMIGRVQRMRFRGKSCVEYKRPVDLTESEKNSKVEFVVSMYSHVNGEYRYAGTDHKTFNIWAIIRSVELKYTPETEAYQLSDIDSNALHEFIVTQKAHQRKKGPPKKTTNQSRADDGRRVVTVEPLNIDNGQRRSKRKRKAIVFDK